MPKTIYMIYVYQFDLAATRLSRSMYSVSQKNLDRYS